MRRFCLVVFTVLISLASFAISKDSVNAVTMVSYEQGWLDSNATLSLKNNTDKDIYNVAYRITYLNMSGEPLDYEDFVSEVDIAPGMTKKVDIEAYERKRHYSYYKSEASYSNPHKFKVKFELTGLNVPDDDDDSIDMESSALVSDVHNGGVHNEDVYNGNDARNINEWRFSLFIATMLIGLSIFVGAYFLVGVMARNRNRSVVAWVIVSFFTTPVLAIVLLLCIGKSYDDF